MNDLQLLAKCYIEAHDLDSKSKKELFEFIDNGSDAEIINLLETGNMEYLTPLEEKQIITEDGVVDKALMGVARLLWNAAKKITGKKPLMSIGDLDIFLKHSDVETVNRAFANLFAASGIAVTVVVAFSFYLAAKYLKERLSQAGKACKGKKGKEFKKCIAQYKLDTYKGQIDLLQQGIKRCKNTKNPQKCTKKLQDKITKIKQKMAKLSKDIQKYK